MSASRNTLQRTLVLQTVQQMHHHPTAEDIYRALAEAHPHISRATVYRNLNLLAERGDIQRVMQPGGADRFDFDLRPHYHFRCRACGQVFDVALPYLDSLLETVENPRGFVFEQYDIHFAGLCPHCAAQQTPE
ncbi:MAG: transcriptional repressor [Ruminococcaceae bacterium]|nr:transcriptional repressor [Oscillospiraceae bacterium]